MATLIFYGKILDLEFAILKQPGQSKSDKIARIQKYLKNI